MSNENINSEHKKEKSPFTDIFLKLIDGMTQQEVADKVGVSRQNVGLWIRGKTVPDIYTLSKIADAFKVSTDYLLGRTENPSVEEDIQIACKVTRLSEETIHNLQIAPYSIIEILNQLIEIPSFYKLVFYCGELQADSIIVLNNCIAPQVLFRASELLFIDYEVLCEYASTLKNWIPYEKTKNFFLNCDLDRYNANKCLESILTHLDLRNKFEEFSIDDWKKILKIDSNKIEELRNKSQEKAELFECEIKSIVDITEDENEELKKKAGD